jgi:hypothetical protein
VFNIGANVPSGILEETARKYFKVWEMACFGGFLMGAKAARRMAPRGKGTMLFTGATASLRGRELRRLRRRQARAARAGPEHGARARPKGIHVAHVVIDGAIDTEFIRTTFPERYALKDQDGILNPEHIAENYWMLHIPAARCLDPRTGPASLDGEILMAKEVEFYFDVGSPAAYLAWKQLPKIAAEEPARKSSTSPSCWAACSRPPATARRWKCRPRATTCCRTCSATRAATACRSRTTRTSRSTR